MNKLRGYSLIDDELLRQLDSANATTAWIHTLAHRGWVVQRPSGTWCVTRVGLREVTLWRKLRGRTTKKRKGKER